MIEVQLFELMINGERLMSSTPRSFESACGGTGHVQMRCLYLRRLGQQVVARIVRPRQATVASQM